MKTKTINSLNKLLSVQYNFIVPEHITPEKLFDCPLQKLPETSINHYQQFIKFFDDLQTDADVHTHAHINLSLQTLNHTFVLSIKYWISNTQSHGHT